MWCYGHSFRATAGFSSEAAEANALRWCPHRCASGGIRGVSRQHLQERRFPQVHPTRARTNYSAIPTQPQGARSVTFLGQPSHPNTDRAADPLVSGAMMCGHKNVGGRSEWSIIIKRCSMFSGGEFRLSYFLKNQPSPAYTVRPIWRMRRCGSPEYFTTKKKEVWPRQNCV